MKPHVILHLFQAALCAYVILLMAVYWLTEALPINVTALLPVCLFPMVGVLSANAVAKAFFTVGTHNNNETNKYLSLATQIIMIVVMTISFIFLLLLLLL